MSFYINNIHLKNFLTFEDQEMSLHDKGLVLIKGNNRDEAFKGSNGVGKTLIGDAILWLLSSETSRGIPADSVIGKFGKSCSVKANMVIGNSNVEVTRYRKDQVYENSITIKEDAVDISHRKIKGTEERLTALIGCSIPLLKLSCFQYGDSTKHFSRIKSQDRAEIIDEIVGASDADIPERAKQVNKMLRDCTNELMTIQHNNAMYRQERMNLLDKIASNDRIMAEQPKIEPADETPLNESMKDYQTEINTLQDLLPVAEEGQRAISIIQDKLNEADKLYRAVERDVASLGHVINKTSQFTHAKPGLICDHCGNPVTEISIDKLKEIKRREHNAYVEQANEKVAALNKIEDAIKVLKGKLKEYSKVKSPDQLRAEIAHVKELAEAHERELTVRKRGAALRKKMEDDRNALIDSLTKENQSLYEKIERVDKSLTNNNFRKWRLEFKISNLEVLSSFYSPSGFRPLVMDHYAPILSECANYFYKDFTNGNGRIIINNKRSLQTGRVVDKITIAVEEQGDARGFPEAWSLGEGGCVDISLNTGIMRLASMVAAKDFGFLYFDEITNSISPKWIQKFFDILKEKVIKQGMTVLITSNNPMPEQEFNEIWTVVKENGRSRIEVQN